MCVNRQLRSRARSRLTTTVRAHNTRPRNCPRPPEQTRRAFEPKQWRWPPAGPGVMIFKMSNIFDLYTLCRARRASARRGRFGACGTYEMPAGTLRPQLCPGPEQAARLPGAPSRAMRACRWGGARRASGGEVGSGAARGGGTDPGARGGHASGDKITGS